MAKFIKVSAIYEAPEKTLLGDLELGEVADESVNKLFQNIKGAFASDAAAVTGGVKANEPYYDSSGALHVLKGSAPTISAVGPASITGTNFSLATSVKVDGNEISTPDSWAITNSTTITITWGGAALEGVYTVTTPFGEASFTYTA